MKNICLLAMLVFASPAFAQSTDWGGAMWVWDEADADKIVQNDEPRYLRCTFDLPAKPQAAELWITADNMYNVHVNGQAVGSGSEWSKVGSYNVAKHLVVGKNVLAIKATNAGGPAGVIARLRIKTADKKNLFVVTNEKTRTTQKPGKDWQKADIDDSTWSAAIALGDASMAPWNLATPPANAGGSPGTGTNYGFNTVDKTITKRLSAQEQLKHFVVPKDFAIELVAADPVIINPITMVLDDKGRIIVSESHTYRYGPPGSPIKPFANPVIRLDPDGKGGFTRTLIADAFDDPVMGIAVKGDKLWLTANNYLYTYNIPEANLPRKGGEEKPKPLAINKKAILIDKNKAWNPFGMFVLEWGPDGKLYISVGDHRIDIHGPDGKISARGNSGMIMRMNADGTKMERLVHGLRVPYSFEYDPFGQLWLLSNGEGNPDRFVRVIEGVDYHCYSRPGISNEWLAGRHPLAPPCEEVHGGAHTQLMRYYAANFPQEYQGNLFACNWGRHGFAGANRGIFRFILDDRNNVKKKETLLACTDPHFRPSHIHLDVDGSLLIADWYGRDDESDMTGRIWRLKYIGKDRPIVKHKLDSAEWKNDDYAIEALGSPDHMVRAKAMQELAKRGEKIVKKLSEHAKSGKEPLGAANALWALAARNEKKSHAAILEGLKSKDWKVMRLALNIAGRLVQGSDDSELAEAYQDGGNDWTKQVSEETYPLIVNELTRFAAKCLMNIAIHKKLDSKIDKNFDAESAANVVAMFLAPLTEMPFDNPQIARDPYLRYEAAWLLAKYAHEKTITNRLTSHDANVRLAGLIAIDVACYENFPSKKAALAALAKALENPGKLDHQLLLEVARLDGDASIVPALAKLIERDDLPAATLFKAVLVMKAKSGPSLTLPAQKAGKRIIEAVEKGSLKIASPADQLVIFEFLESEGPTPFALKQIEGQLRSNNKDLKQAAHTLARRFGPKASSLADGLWPSVLNPKTKFDDTIEYLSTIARTDSKVGEWENLLKHEDPYVRMEAVRWWRKFDGMPKMTAMLAGYQEGLIKKDDKIRDDLDTVLRQIHPERKETKVDKDALTKYAVEDLTKMPAADRGKRAAMGLQVFERNSCTKCHTTATATTLLAPSLKGVGTQKVEYLIESVLFPSKIIKTGWEVEVIELKNGKQLSGLVKDEGKHLRVLNLDKDDRVLKTDVESRSTSKVSVMPEGQEATLSRREFVDLIAYLQTLK